MALTFKKLTVEDLDELRGLVAEHVGGIEGGLAVLDQAFLLGSALVDLLAVDPRGGLSLLAVGTQASDEMLLRSLDAYGWCRDNAETLRRLYPRQALAVERPPRLVFIAPRFSDGFRRKVRCLTPPVLCLEFRYLEVNGVRGLFFDPIEGEVVERPPVPRVAPAPPVTPEAAGVPADVSPVEAGREVPREPDDLAKQLERLRFREAFRIDSL